MPRVPSVGMSPSSSPGLSAPGVVAYDGSVPLRQLEEEGIQKQRLGSAIQKISNEIEDKVNDARALEASNFYEAGVNKALLEYRSKKGKDAVTAREDLEKFIEQQEVSANAMLANDFQRSQFGRVANKIKNRAELSIESHYMEAAAQDKQQQLIARRMLKADALSGLDLTVKVKDQDIVNPQALVEFGQFNTLLLQEGEARGLTGDALEVFMVSERDKLFSGIVNLKLDTEDEGQINQVKSLIRDLPDGVISQVQRATLNLAILDKSDESISSEDIIDAYGNGDTLQDVFKQADLMRDNGILTEKKWKKYRDQASAYYRQQREAESLVVEGLLDEARSLTDQGLPVPSELKSRAAELGIKSSLDKILEGSDDWLPEGRNVWADYEMNPTKALDDYQSDPKGFIERLDGMMPWGSVQQIIRSAKALEESQSSSRRGKRSGSNINLLTEREVANGLLQQYSYGFGQKYGLASYKDNKGLPDWQKANIERRWRTALQPLVQFEMAKDPDLSVENAVQKVAPRLWKTGEYTGASDGKPRNKWSEADYHISGYAADLENEVDADGIYGVKGRKLVDIAREDIQRDRADEALRRKMIREASGDIPLTPALLGFPEAEKVMRSNEEIRQKVMGEMKANMEMFGVPIPSDDTPLYVSQQEVYDRVNKMIQDTIDQGRSNTETGRNNRELVAIERLDRAMSGEDFKRIGEEEVSGFEALSNEATNWWNYVFSSKDDPYVPLPTMSPGVLEQALQISKTLTVVERGQTVNVHENFIANHGSEEEWRELVGNHAISNYSLMPKPVSPLEIQKIQGRKSAGGRGGTTYAERVQAYQDVGKSVQSDDDISPRKKKEGRLWFLNRRQKQLHRTTERIQNQIQRHEGNSSYSDYVAKQKAQLDNVLKKISEQELEIRKLTDELEQEERQRIQPILDEQRAAMDRMMEHRPPMPPKMGGN